MRIDLLVNPTSQYGVLNSFERGIKAALMRRGVEVKETVIDNALLDRLKTSDANYTLSVNLFMGKLQPQTPHIVFLVDWGTYIPESYKSFSTIICHVDAQSAAYVAQNDICQNIFLPHAIDQDDFFNGEEKGRDIEILFTGTFQDENLIREKLKKTVSKELLQAIMEVAENTVESARDNHVKNFDEMLEENPMFQNEIEDKNLSIHTLYNEVENLFRARDRISLISSIERPVHIYGKEIEAWKKALIKKKNCVFHDPIEFDKTNALFRRSKIVLNSSPMFKEGLHERILYAVANGASVLTNKNLFIPHCFKENLALGTFLAPDYQDVNDKIERMLKTQDQRQVDILSTQETIKSKHTWDSRVDHLLKKLEA